MKIETNVPLSFYGSVLRIFVGSTSLPFPFPFSYLLGNELDLGYVFKIYIIMLGIYCTNAINICRNQWIRSRYFYFHLGQSIIAACSQLLLFTIRALISGNSQKYEYSSFLLLTFLGSALALMKYNAYPSQVFVGDTFCYFAGILIALSAIYCT